MDKPSLDRGPYRRALGGVVSDAKDERDLGEQGPAVTIILLSSGVATGARSSPMNTPASSARTLRAARASHSAGVTAS